ncbi:MAG: hypothetical protein K6E35_01695 [Bacteroidales bacterium]|nr:hypothetical protein [Bacteroidales bacterium]
MSEEYDEITIDWVELLAKFLKNWRFIALMTGLFFLVGVSVALLTPRQYKVTMTLAPEVPREGSSNLSNIASMFGVSAASTSTGQDAINITLFPEICKSTPFLTELFPVVLTPYVSSEDAENGVVAEPTTVFDYLTGKGKDQKGLYCWLLKIFGEEKEEKSDELNLSKLTKEQACVVDALSRSITAEVEKNTGITKISVVMDDKLMVTQLADTVCRRLQDYVTMYRTRKAQEDFDYYVKLADEAQAKMVKAQAAYAAAIDHDRDLILQSVSSHRDRLRQEADLSSQIYSQMAQQRELARAKIQEEKPVFAVIQPATMPQTPEQSRRQAVLIWSFVGFLIACFWVAFGRNAFEIVQKGLRESQV